MKKVFRWLAALCIPVILSACGGSNLDPGAANTANDMTPAEVSAATTVMLYVVGSDLESKSGAAQANLADLVAATGSKDVNVVVTTGGANKANDKDLVTDWRTVRRYVVRDGKLALLSDMGQQNMAESATLSDFIVWAKKAYPAKNYRLVLWDHGAATNGFGLDEISGKVMSVPALQSALRTATQQSGIHFDLIGFDACLMANAEVARALAPYADYLAASEELEPGGGWDYRAILSSLAARPDMSGPELGRVITDSYLAYQKKLSDANQAVTLARDDAFTTFSVIDLSRIGAVTDAIASFSNVLSAYVQKSADNWVGVARERSLATSFGPQSQQSLIFDMVDLGVFADRLASANIVVEASRRVSSAVSHAVIYRGNGTLAGTTSGLSIYFPSLKLDPANLEAYNNLDFAQEYKSLLGAYVSYANLQTATVSVDVSRLNGNLLNAVAKSTFGLKYATLGMVTATDSPNIVRVVASRPVAIGMSGQAVMTTRLNEDWLAINGQPVPVEELSKEARAINGVEKTVTSYGVGAFINNEFTILVFENAEDSTDVTFVGTYDGQDEDSGGVAKRIQNTLTSTDQITLATYDYDLVKQDIVAVHPTNVTIEAGSLELGMWSNPHKLGDLRLMVEDFRETAKMSDVIPFNF